MFVHLRGVLICRQQYLILYTNGWCVRSEVDSDVNGTFPEETSSWMGTCIHCRQLEDSSYENRL